MKTIIIKVEPDGQIQIEAVGFKGSACEAATAAMEQALGVTTTRKKKPERYVERQQTVGN